MRKSYTFKSPNLRNTPKKVEKQQRKPKEIKEGAKTSIAEKQRK